MSEQLYQVKKTRDIMKAVFETQFVGLTRVLVGIPIEHVFDRLKTQVQSELKANSILQVYKSVVKKNGFLKGVFAGFSSNLALLVLKQYYRWPMMILIPRYLKENLPESLVDRFPTLHKAITGATIGVVESIITCPLERIKCQLMTKEQTKTSTLMTLWKTEKSTISLVRNLYTGMEVLMMKQMVSWVNYLYWDHKIRYIFKETPNTPLNGTEILMCSVLTSVPNILFVQPFDTVKTLYQMENNKQYKSLTVFKAFQKVYHEQGIAGFYSGWRIRMTQFFIQAILTTPVIDYLERAHGLPKSV